jgi:hypothetical protein
MIIFQVSAESVDAKYADVDFVENVRGGKVLSAEYCYYTYHSRFMRRGSRDISDIFLLDARVLPKLLSNKECRSDR